MPRRNKRQRHRPRGPAAPSAAGGARIESGPDGEWAVRSVSAVQSGKVYRCPGCDHPIELGVAHLVAWRVDEMHGVEDRRHWHNGCWSGRERRGLTRRWS